MNPDPSGFKRALSRFASGVTVVTYHSEGIDSGITVSAFSSVSLEPPLVLVCIHKESPAAGGIRESGNFTVNILNTRQKEISDTFARPDASRLEYLKTEGIPRGIFGVCHIPESLASLDCELYSQSEAGDHWIFLGKVVSIGFPEIEPADTGISIDQPLIYYNRNYRTIRDL